MFSPTQGSAREPVDADELALMLQAGTVIIDDRRTRPYYFDGRFLTAKDLTRDQTYFLTRQADLGKAGGFGVVQGLMVSRQGSIAGSERIAASIVITAGHGVTPSGELVLLTEDLPINLADLPEIQRLDAAFGLASIPSEPLRNATGVFVLALRPIEYTANPIASYSTSVTGGRSTNNGDIIEAVAVSLIPYSDLGNEGAEMARSRVAREIFIEGSTRGLLADALPLAMIAMSGGVVQWVDPYLVRREVGAEQSNILSLGFAPRALKEAHLLQYQQQLQELLKPRSDQRISAANYFRSLPPAGQLPAASINAADLSQIFFPPTVDVSLSFIPSDEVAALVEESLLLPPIDLTQTQEALDTVAVLVLIPVNRQNFQQLQRSLPSLSRAILPAAPGLVAKRSPLEALQGLRLPRFPVPPVLNPEDLTDAKWKNALKTANLLWYIRRRNLPYRSDNVGFNITIFSNDLVVERRLKMTLDQAGLGDRVNTLKTVASSAATANMVSLLSSPKVIDSPLLLKSVVNELDSAKTAIPVPSDTPTETTSQPTEVLDQAGVAAVATRFGDPKLGEGILRLEATNQALKADAVATTVASSGAVPELDLIARTLPENELQTFSNQLAEVAQTQGATAVNNLILTKKASLPLSSNLSNLNRARLGGLQP
jgi:hypothetical protein